MNTVEPADTFVASALLYSSFEELRRLLKSLLTGSGAALLMLLTWCVAPARADTPIPLGQANPLLRPPLQEGSPIPVSVALHVINLADIDEVGQRFHLMFYLFVQWHDSRLAFKPSGPHERFHVFAADQVWHPRMVFITAIGPRSMAEQSVRVNPEGNALYVERSDAVLSCRFRLRRFPFDWQTLAIIIHPFVGQAQIVSFQSSQQHSFVTAGEAAYSSLADWQVMGIRAQHGDVTLAKFGAIPEAHFEIVVRRKYDFYLWKIFLPLLLMVMLSWTVYWIDTRDLSSQVQISITTILTVIAFAFSISLSLPKVPYLTFIDAFFLDCLVFVFFTAIEMTIVHVSGRTRHAGLGHKIRRASRLSVPIAFVVSAAIIAFHYFG